uniref:Zinc finger, CCHC-type n=1 Tax=Tanacetum cinerariifolium TaxID=118510 RepID=A0A6L2LCC2_TANCI|nr:zinc finger, CCHC-type [Tanacetum cinerariifolium]
MAGNTVKEMTTNFEKLDKFEGHDFRRWQKKMHFLLTTLNVVYVLSTPMPELMEADSVEAIKRRAKWENDDYICRGHILNCISHSLFDIYQNVELAKELWNSLDSKYMEEDASSKKFLVSNFNNYKMVDSRPVMEQFNEFLRILGQYTQHGLKMDESIYISSVTDKLPHSKKDFKQTLKQGEEVRNGRDYGRTSNLLEEKHTVHGDGISIYKRRRLDYKATASEKSRRRLNIGRYDTQYYMENPEQAFVDYTSSCTDEARGRGFLETSNVVIDYRKAKIAVGEGVMRSVFGLKETDPGEEKAPYWTTLGKRKSYKPRPSSDGIGAQTLYYARKEFMDCHLPGESEMARDAEINPFKDVLVFRRMVEFLGALRINLKGNIWESEDLIVKPINWNKKPKDKDGTWHAKIKIIGPDGEEFTKTFQSIPTSRKLSEKENPREIIDLDHFYDT